MNAGVEKLVGITTFSLQLRPPLHRYRRWLDTIYLVPDVKSYRFMRSIGIRRTIDEPAVVDVPCTLQIYQYNTIGYGKRVLENNNTTFRLDVSLHPL